jgi:lipopolysaccharide transport system ATP-binding protein
MGPAEQVARRYFQFLNHDAGAADDEDTAAEVVSPPTATPSPASITTTVRWPAHAGISVNDAQQIGNGWARCTRVLLCNTEDEPQLVFEQGSPARFYYEIELLHDMNVPSAGIGLHDRTGMMIHAKHLMQHHLEPPARIPAGTRLCYRHNIVLRLMPGEYTYHVGVFTLPPALHKAGQISEAEVLRQHIRVVETHNLGRLSVVGRTRYHGLQPTHWGVADLDGSIAWGVLAEPGANGGML